MKDILRVVLIMAIGLAIAILIYPFIHESGHFVACKLVGAEVSKFSLFPAFVECNILNLSKQSVILIGISGNLLPTIVMIMIMLIVKPKNMYILYAKIYSAFTCWLSWLLSLVNIIAIQQGYSELDIVKTEDIAQVVINYPEITVSCILLCIVMVIISQAFMINKKVIRAVKEQLEAWV